MIKTLQLQEELTAGGLDTSWERLPSVYYDVDALTHYWRKGVIRLLRTMLRAGKLLTELPDEEVEQEFLRQQNRWWSVNLQSLGSKNSSSDMRADTQGVPPSPNVAFWGSTKKR